MGTKLKQELIKKITSNEIIKKMIRDDLYLIYEENGKLYFKTKQDVFLIAELSECGQFISYEIPNNTGSSLGHFNRYKEKKQKIY